MDPEATTSSYDYYNKTENATVDNLQKWPLTLFVFPVLYILIFILGLCGNGVVIFMVCRAQGKRRATDLYIGNLAVADLIFVVTLPLSAVYVATGYHWPFGMALCKIINFLMYLNMFASVFCLTCMSFDRYLSIVHSRSTARLHKCGHVRASLIAIWLLSGLLAIPFLVFRSTKYKPIHSTTSCTIDVSLVASSPEQVRQWTAGLGICAAVVGFLIPLLIMTVCYCLIGCTISRHFNILRKDDQKKQRLLKIITSVVVVFAACWMPLHMLKTIEVLSQLFQNPVISSLQQNIYSAYPYAISLAYSNSCINPFLYAFFDQRFRSLCLCRKPPELSEDRSPVPGSKSDQYTAAERH